MKNLKFILILVLSIFCFGIFTAKPITAYATIWIDVSDSDIYKSGEANTEDSDISNVGGGFDSVSLSESHGNLVDSLGELFGSLLTLLADQFYDALSRIGININSIIYGRVGGAAEEYNNINLTSFELVEGNVYGIIGSAIYQVMSSFMLLVIICVFTGRLAAYLVSPNVESKVSSKDFLNYGLVAVICIFLMPYILYCVQYLRDVLLYMTAMGGGAVITSIRNALGSDYNGVVAEGIGYSQAVFGSGSKYNLIYQLGISASYGKLFPSLLYCGGVILTVYFMMLYIAQALSMVILYVLFPLICVMGVFNKQLFSEWIKNVLSILLYPIIDSILLYIALCFFILSEDQTILSGFTIVALGVAASIIPARGQVRQWLGISTGTAFEKSGFGAVLGVYGMVKSAVGLLGQVGMAVATEGASLKAAASSNNLDSKLEPISLKAAGLQSAIMSDYSEEKDNSDGFLSASDDEKEKMTNSKAGIMDGMSNEEKLKGRASAISDIRNDYQDMKAEAQDDIRAIDRNINSSKMSIAQSEAIKAANPDNKDIQAQENANIANERSKIQQNEILKSTRLQDIKRLDDKIGKTDQALKTLRAGYGAYITNSPEDQAMQQQYDEMANVDNFELPEFTGKISMKRRAELQRKRAMRQAITSGAQAGGMLVGGTAGMLIGAGSMSFMGTDKMMLAGSLGMQAGQSIGNRSGTLIGSAYALGDKVIGERIKINSGNMDMQNGTPVRNETVETVIVKHENGESNIGSADTRSVRQIYDYNWKNVMSSMNERGRNEYRDIMVGAQKETLSMLMANRANGQYSGLYGPDRIRLIQNDASNMYFDIVTAKMQQSQLVREVERRMQNVDEYQLRQCLLNRMARDSFNRNKFNRMLDAMGMYSEDS